MKADSKTAARRAASFTLQDGRLVTFDRMSENSVQLWDDVKMFGPFVGSAHFWESA